MININVSDLRKIDLNLALVFCVIHDAKSVTVAAQRLYLTQPAISASLAKLRELTADRLFVLQGRQLMPTPVADQLAITLGPALAELQTGFLHRERFDPSVSSRVLRVGLLDDLEISVLPALIAYLRTNAPNIKLSIRNTDFRSIARHLNDDYLDVALGVFDELPKTARREEIARCSYRVLFDPEQVLIKRKLTIDQYLGYDHALVSFSGDFHGLFEEEFAKGKLKRNVVMNTPRFSALPFVLKQSPLLATIPEYLAFHFAKSFNLATVPIPYETKSFPIEMVWPARLAEQPEHQWFRALLGKILRKNVLSS